ncbi:uncharacterized protein [Thunnus thynnus]|uniref:uncharacterized protein isoform X3 n=1 Tax=Thunnus thynnus TaxID=8237 RepID=UPI003528C3A0
MMDSRSAADLMAQQTTAESLHHPCTDGDRAHEDHISYSRLLEVSGSGESSAELIFGGSQEQDETEQIFPKIIPEIPKKSRKAEIYLRGLKKMHDLCVTNMDFSRRLLDRETDSLCWQEERGIQDLVLPGIDSKQGKKSQTDQPALSSVRQPSVQSGRPSSPQQQSNMTSASRRCFESLVWDTAMCCRKTPDPLSIEDVCQQKHVKVIDRGLKLWRNYTENTDY